jgi:hypothetical protein
VQAQNQIAIIEGASVIRNSLPHFLHCVIHCGKAPHKYNFTARAIERGISLEQLSVGRAGSRERVGLLREVSGEIVKGVAHVLGFHGFYLPDWRGKENRRDSPAA